MCDTGVSASKELGVRPGSKDAIYIASVNGPSNGMVPIYHNYLSNGDVHGNMSVVM